jgi:hypothetical protein
LTLITTGRRSSISGSETANPVNGSIVSGKFEGPYAAGVDVSVGRGVSVAVGVKVGVVVSVGLGVGDNVFKIGCAVAVCVSGELI